MKIRTTLSVLMLLFFCKNFGQVGINTPQPHQKSALDIVSTNNNTGVLFPRLTTAQISAISPTSGDILTDGLWVYNIDTKCYNYWASSPKNQWLEFCGSPIALIIPGIATINCAGTNTTGTLIQNIAASGVSASVPYTVGNGGTYTVQSIASTGVTGLTATLAAGNFATGAGNLIFTISGTPSAAGTASFNINMGGTNCTFTVPVTAGAGLATINCAGTGTTGALVQNTAASGVSATVPYTAGNGGSYTAQNISSTGVTGLTATIAAGSFANGAGNLVFTISGTPSAAGTASFNINMGGTNCTFTVPVTAGAGLATINCAGATTAVSVIQNTPAVGVATVVPYNAGNGGSYTAQSINSTGVTGLTATISAGNFATGAGNLIFTISGTPSAAGTASFNLSMGGTNCTFTIQVQPGEAEITISTACASTIQTFGTYKALKPLTASEYVTVQLTVTKPGRLGLITDDFNGMKFQMTERDVAAGLQTFRLDHVASTTGDGIGRYPLTSEETSNGAAGSNNQSHAYVITNTVTGLPVITACRATIDVKPQVIITDVDTGSGNFLSGGSTTGSSDGLITMYLTSKFPLSFWNAMIRNLTAQPMEYSFTTTSTLDPNRFSYAGTIPANGTLGSLDPFQYGLLANSPTTSGTIGAHAGSSHGTEVSEVGIIIKSGTYWYKYRIMYYSAALGGANTTLVLLGKYTAKPSVYQTKDPLFASNNSGDYLP